MYGYVFAAAEVGVTHRSLEAEYAYSCIRTSAREDTYSAVFGRIPLYSLYSHPSYSRGALKTLHSTRIPALRLVYSARRHRIRRDIMLYPGYEPHLGRPPSIMHYGADYTLGRAYFNKMNYQQLRLEECSRHLLDTSSTLPRRFLDTS